MNSPTLIIGLGSAHGDDRVGWHIAACLRRSLGRAATVQSVADPWVILDFLDGVRTLHICDCCQSHMEVAAPPGVVHRWTWPDLPACAPNDAGGTHGAALNEVLALGERLGLLPPKVTIWGVEMAAAQPGMEMGQAVARAAEVVAQRIAGEVLDA